MLNSAKTSSKRTLKDSAKTSKRLKTSSSQKGFDGEISWISRKDAAKTSKGRKMSSSRQTSPGRGGEISWMDSYNLAALKDPAAKESRRTARVSEAVRAAANRRRKKTRT